MMKLYLQLDETCRLFFSKGWFHEVELVSLIYIYIIYSMIIYIVFKDRLTLMTDDSNSNNVKWWPWAMVHHSISPGRWYKISRLSTWTCWGVAVMEAWPWQDSDKDAGNGDGPKHYFFFLSYWYVYTYFAHTCRRSWLELMLAAVVIVIVIIVIVIHYHHETMMVNVVIIKSKVYCKYHSILGGNSAVLSSRATTKAHTPSPQMDASVLHIIDESISTRGPPSPSLNSLTGTFYSNFRRRIQIGLTSNGTKSPGGETPYIQCQ